MAQYSGKKIISLIGPIGSGKGTQADKLAEELNMHHFDTSRVLRKFLAAALPDDQEARKEKELYQAGELLSPPFVCRVLLGEIRVLLADINGVVFSGSPRTVYEFECELPAFDELVGAENVHLFYIELSKEEAIKRNSARLVCEKNRHPIPNLPGYEEARKLMVCPKDGSRLIKRSLDSAEMIAKRYDVYLRDTKPILDKAKELGYKFIEINGDQTIEKVHEDIRMHLS
ncbi:MAG: nucleoside monophosphate kinase [bacterium]|nr:nucleoside monophosphate kinase [bacterium]